MKILIYLLFFAAVPAYATSLDFTEIRIADLVRVIYSDLNGDAVMIASELIKDERTVSYYQRATTALKAKDQTRQILESMGYRVEKIGGVYHVDKAAPEKTETLIYNVRAKSAAQLAEVVAGIVPGFRQLDRRPLTSAAPTPATVDTPPGTASQLVTKSAGDVLIASVPVGEINNVRTILAAIDRAPAEVTVKALLVEVSATENQASAVNALLELASGKVGISWTGGAESARGVTLKFGALDAVISALETDKRYRVLSAPRIRVNSGVKARFAVGSEVPVLGSVTHPQSGQPVQSVDYRNAGVILDVLPTVLNDRATLEINQQLSNFVQTTTGVNNSPTLLKRELSTTVQGVAGDVLVIAGLEEEKTNNDKTGFFFMPEMLRSKSSDSTRSTIVMILHIEAISTAI